MSANVQGAAQNGVFSLVCRTLYDQKSINDLCSITPSAGSPAGAATDAWGWAQVMSAFFAAVAAGSQSISVEYSDGNSTGFGTGTITFTGAPANNDTVTIAGVTITFKTSGATGSQVNIGGSQAACMANLVTFINANGSANNLIGLVNATLTSSTVITITSDYPGLVGNLITMSKSCTNISAITATLTGGALVTQSFPIMSIGI